MKKTWRLVRLLLALLVVGVLAGGCKSSNETLSKTQESSPKESGSKDSGNKGEISTETKKKTPIKREVTTNIEEGEFQKLGSYRDLYLLMSKFTKEQSFDEQIRTDGEMSKTSDTLENSMNTEVDGNTESRTGDYAKTNVVVEGVDEGDIIKTDGSYLYVRSSYYDSEEISNESVVIIRADGAHMTKVSEAKVQPGHNVQEFYVIDNMLYVVSMKYIEKMAETMVTKFDITNRNEPKMVNYVKQDGSYHTSRYVDGMLYLITIKWNNRYDYFAEGKGYETQQKQWQDKYQPFLPSVNGIGLPIEDIYIPKEVKETSFCIMSSIDLEKRLKVKDSKSILGGCADVYMSDKGIYFTRTVWSEAYEETVDYTKIYKFTYDKGEIQLIATKRIKGTVRDTFAIDEYKNYLRIVTTIENSDINGDIRESNSLYILDDLLRETGGIYNLAKGEVVYSARFLGDTGFFVTYKNTDPLFSVDLSDPKNPRILGELKIPGFSEYLHFYSKDLLLGIGVDVKEEGVNGLKLSMFDISDPSNVTEESIEKLPYSYSAALYNYKSVIIDKEKNLIAFSGEGYDEEEEEYQVDQLVYSYDRKKGFVCKNRIETNLENYEDSRMSFIGDTLYVVSFNDSITAYSLSDNKALSKLCLQ